MSGYLRYKKGSRGWKRLWFVLKDRVLYTYKASSVSSLPLDSSLHFSSLLFFFTVLCPVLVACKNAGNIFYALSPQNVDLNSSKLLKKL